MAGILIIVQTAGGELGPTAGEVASEARRLASATSTGVAAAVLGPNATAAAVRLGRFGIARAVVAESPAPGPEWLLAAATAAVKNTQPDIVLLPHSGAGRELGATLAFTLGGGVVSDCTSLRIDGDALLATKPVFGGSAISEQAILVGPRVATLRARAFEATEAPAEVATSPVVEPLDVPSGPGRVEVIEVVQTEAGDGPRLKDARIIVSGGRGLGTAESWAALEELARVLGAALGASRAITDAGWVAPALQVGLTGVSVAPDLYIAVGISGAVQHVAGITGARNVVAINRDPDANIFKYARFGVVGDWKQVVPAFTERLRELRG